MLTGRIREQKMLRDAFASEYSEFIAVYGRRRVGKTFLIRETFGYRFTFQHAGLAKGNTGQQLDAFCESLEEAGLKGFERPSNWMDAFKLLKDLIRSSTEKKKIIFLDELSWMDGRKSDLMTALEFFWNAWASARKDILLIVCGSATSWILDKVVHDKGGLHNRLSGQISLKPFTLGECREYIKSKNIIMETGQILECYMIMGGIPYYWSQLKKGQSLSQNIDRIFFEEGAPLADEFDYLYASLFKNPDIYIRIVTALGKKKAGMSREELLSEAGLSDSGAITKKLEELESCGFIRKYSSFGKKKRNAFYQLIDNFTLFYFKFMADHPGDRHFWMNQVNTPARNIWCGFAFERVCLQHIEGIKNKLGISGVLTEVNAWSCKPDIDNGIFGSQIDLLIVRADRVINVCEMKYYGAEFVVTKRFADDMRRKISDLKTVTGTKYAIYPTLITSFGIVENSYSGELQSVVTGEDLFF